MDIIKLILHSAASGISVSLMLVGALAAVVGVLDGRQDAYWARGERNRSNAELDAHEQANVDAWPNPFADYA